MNMAIKSGETDGEQFMNIISLPSLTLVQEYMRHNRGESGVNTGMSYFSSKIQILPGGIDGK